MLCNAHVQGRIISQGPRYTYVVDCQVKFRTKLAIIVPEWPVSASSEKHLYAKMAAARKTFLRVASCENALYRAHSSSSFDPASLCGSDCWPT